MKLADYMVLFVKGVIIGIGINIFSISFAVLLFVLNLYKRIINIFSSFDNFKSNFKSVLAVFLGIILGIISGYNFINYTLVKFNMPVMIFFIGFIYGGISLFIKDVKKDKNIYNFLIILISFILMVGLNFLIINSSSNVFLGLLSLFIPGINISFIYNISYSFINIVILIIGIILFSKIINYFINKFNKFNYIVLGFIMASIVMILYNTKLNLSFVSIIMSLFTFGWGFLLSKAIDRE